MVNITRVTARRMTDTTSALNVESEPNYNLRGGTFMPFMGSILKEWGFGDHQQAAVAGFLMAP